MDSGFTGNSAPESKDVLKNLIGLGAELGVQRILIPFLGDSEIKDETQKLEIISNLKTCLKTAEKYNVELALETSLPAEELRKFIFQFKSPLVKIYYDTGNCTTFVGQKVPEEIRLLGKLITGLHIKDRKFQNTTSYVLGKGEAKFTDIFQVLKEIGFRGPFILEAARDLNTDDIALNKSYLEFIKNHLLKPLA